MTTCGYLGHRCAPGKVQFISRYHNENDYCVGGTRVHLYDDSTVRNATPDQINALELYLLADYAEYLTWHSEQRIKYGKDWPQVQPWNWQFPLQIERRINERRHPKQ